MSATIRKIRNKALTVFLCCVFYFVVSIPFIDYLRLSETTEVRPYCVLPFLLSLVYGFWGALGTAIGNIFSDLYYGGMDYRILPMGASFQIIYGYGGSLIWKHLRRGEQNIFRLDKVKKIAQYLIVVFIISAVLSLMVWMTLYSFYGLEIFGLGFISTLLNHLVFFVVLGIPFFVVYSYHLQKKNREILLEQLRQKNRSEDEVSSAGYLFSINEKFILYFVFISVVVAIFVSAIAYFFFSSYDLYDQTVLWGYVYLICGVTLYVCLCPTLLILNSVEEHISKPIEELSCIGQNFGDHDNINSEIQYIKSIVDRYTSYKSEIGELAFSFRIFSQKIDEYIQKLTSISKEQSKVATQLHIASDIQNGVLPEPIMIPEIDFYASMDPALEVGGDFYDYFRIGNDKFCFVVADVSDKGIPASLFMMISKTIIHKNLKDSQSPGTALIRANNELCQNNRAQMFVTVFCGILDLNTGLLKYASAGHDHPIISVNSGDFTIMKNKTGFVLGEIEDINYTESEIFLERGDTIFVYTDGVPEASNENNEMYGFDRTLEVLNLNRRKNMSEMCCSLKEDISTFKNSAKQFDDITVMAIRRN